MTFSEFYKYSNQELKSIYPETEIDAFIQIICKYLFGLSRIDGILRASEIIPESSESQIYNIIHELKRNKPIQYILGETEFYGLRFFVDQNVLIPRPETEELVDWIVFAYKQLTNLIIVDIGTGSGCIPVALAKNIPGSEVWALDISESALDIAQKNAIENDVNVKFLYYDILKRQQPISQQFDVIVSNPPYVTIEQKKLMGANVLNFEPHLALFVPETNPFVFYEAISEFAKTHLKHNGSLYFEINEEYPYETITSIEKYGFSCELKKDINGKYRMIKANRK